MRMRCIILSSVASPAVPRCFTLSHWRHYFRKRLSNLKYVCWFSLQLLSEIFLILRRNGRDMIMDVHRYSSKIPVFFFNILIKLGLSRHSFDKYSHIKFHKNASIGSRVVPWGQTDGRTDGRTHRQTWRSQESLFCNFATAPKKEVIKTMSKEGESKKVIIYNHTMEIDSTG